MNKGNDISDELKSINSLLADAPRDMPYYVPAGYFRGLTNDINESVKAEEAEVIPTPSWNKEMPFDVPAGYFETVPVQLAALAKNSEQHLNISKVQPFGTPAGYFENLPAQILMAAKAGEQQQTKTIPLGRRIYKNLRWAVAAVLILGIGFTSYNILWKHDDNYNAKKALAQLPEDIINEYVQQNIDDFDMEQLENTIAANTSVDPFNTDILSDEEIILYLDETGWDQTEVN